jgi:hypothetical protein
LIPLSFSSGFWFTIGPFLLGILVGLLLGLIIGRVRGRRRVNW